MLVTVGLLLGGLGLFLLAVTMITDGLKLAAGDTLKDILARYTRTPWRGVLSGMLVTGIVQSSSAVTVATIGFVNAGLLTLTQSLGVVYGANIGTTMTGWLVATVGLDLDLEALALPLVGLGMLAGLLPISARVAALGEALAGFGLFFIGISVLQDAFQTFAADVDVATFAPQGPVGMVLYVGLGFLMTLLTQSSSAAIALTLTAASGGALALEAAAAMVVGANVGTTSTAALATLGATANARRVAAAHVLFNALTGAVALVLLPLMLWATALAGDMVGLDAPAASLALFHTTFNVLGVALMWPLTPRLARFLAHRFLTRAESLAQPAYMDRTVLVAPALAVEALKRELVRATQLARSAAATAVSAEGETSREAAERLHGLRGLLGAMESFVAELEGGRLSPQAASDLPQLLRVSNYLEDVVGLAEALAQHRRDVGAVMRPPVTEAVSGFQAAVVAQLDRCRPEEAQFDRQDAEAGLADLERRWHALKTVLLEAAGRHELPLARLNGALEGLRRGLRMAEQLTKAAVRLNMLPPAAGDGARIEETSPSPHLGG